MAILINKDQFVEILTVIDYLCVVRVVEETSTHRLRKTPEQFLEKSAVTCRMKKKRN